MEETLLPKKNFYENDPEHVSRYVYASKFVENKNTLDAACGRGYGTHFLSTKAKRIVGIDIVDEYIRFAKTNYPVNNLQFLTRDVTKMGLPDDEFDTVVSFETIEHVPEPELFLKEITRVLKKDGIFLVSTPNALLSPPDHGKLYNEFHVKEFSEKELRELLSRFFYNVEIMGQYPKNSNSLLVHDYLQKYNRWNSLPSGLRKLIPTSIKNQLIKTMKMRRGPMANFTWEDIMIDKFDPDISFVLVALCKEPKKS